MKRIIGLLFIIYIVFLILVNVNAYSKDNTIEDLLYKYNVVTLGQNEPLSTSWYTDNYPKGTLTKVAHIVGPILVEGNLGTSDYPSIEHSQITYGISSYIQGSILAQGHAGGSTSLDTKLYIGISNTLERYCEIYNWGCNEDNMNQYRVNGKEYYTRYETIKDTTDNKYLDFTLLYNDIVSEQAKLEKGEVIDGVSDLYLESGNTYTINNIQNVSNIHITDYRKDDITLININDTMIDNFPKVLIEDNQVSTNDYIYKNGDNESYYGNIVFSLPNARNISFPSSSFIGHIIAPKADIFMNHMNFAGTIISNSLTGSGSTEGHLYPYTLSSLPKEGTSNSNSNKEVKDAIEDNPETLDNVIQMIISIIVSTILICSLTYILFNYKKKNE